MTQIPLPTRSSEAGAECPGRVFLSYLREDEQQSASYFILGTALHDQIEEIILYDVDENDALDELETRIGHALDEAGDLSTMLTTNNRDLSTIYEDGERMLTNWFTHVHPDSEKRIDRYNDYHWPPKVEHRFMRSARSAGTKYPVWGSIDALFDKPKREQPPMIVDWKSGVRRPTTPFQLDYYRFGSELPDALAHYHMLDRVRRDSVTVISPKYAGDEAVRSSILMTEARKDAVLRGEVPKFVPDWYCDYCPVKELCPEVPPDVRVREKNLTKLQDLLQSVEALRELPDEGDLSSRD